MPRSTIHPPKAAADYTPPDGGNEVANRRSGEPGGTGMHQPTNPKETTMFRTFTTAATLALTITAAQAGPANTVHFGDLDLSRPGDTRVLDSRIHQAAETACASFRSSKTKNFYRTWFENCVSNAVADTTARIAAISSSKPRAVASK
jgi:UrcA family protein